MFLLRKDGQNFGPFNLDELRELVNAGSISPDTEAAAEGSENWQPIRLIIGQPPQIPSSFSPPGTESPYSSAAETPSSNFYSVSNSAPDLPETTSPVTSGLPVGVLLLTILYSLNALFFLLLMLVAIVFQNAPKLVLQRFPQFDMLIHSGALGLISGFGALVGIIAMVLCALYIFVAYGIYNLRNWARITGIVLACFGILNQLQSCVVINAVRFSPVSFRLIFPFSISCAIIYYLSNEKTKKHYV